MSTDRIEKKIILRATRARVWRALSDSGEFGKWFGCRLDGPFEPGARVTGQITIPGYDHLRMELHIERIEKETLLSMRWHPNAVDPKHDYSNEPTTLVEFRLADAPGGTELTVTESGFDGIPIERRAAALRSNDAGWAIQLENIARHVAQ
jgi:uncharacterized protein YndB with AHSA1/START domain